MIVVATFRTVDPETRKETFTDTYTHVETIDEAERVYTQNIQEEGAWTASICEVIKSTDYEPTLVNSQINFKKLRRQKEILANLIMSEGEADDKEQRKDAKRLEGLLNLLDSIQDEAVEFGWASEKEVFGSLKN